MSIGGILLSTAKKMHVARCCSIGMLFYIGLDNFFLFGFSEDVTSTEEVIASFPSSS
jgi:hypothetical protein